jgi:hypothetical protein
MKNNIIGFTYLTISYLMIWFQLYGSIKSSWLKQNNYWFMYIVALPISYFITEGTRLILIEYKDSTWAVRFISFSINMFIFTIMSYLINNEGINLKSLVCIGLTIIILLIQIFWK